MGMMQALGCAMSAGIVSTASLTDQGITACLGAFIHLI